MKIEVVKTNVPGLPVRISKRVKPDKWECFCQPHIHDDIEILAGYTGVVQVSADNENMLLRKGDIIIINRRIPHATEAKEPNSSSVLIQFRIEKLRASEFENINRYLSLLLTNGEKRVIYLPRESAVTSEIYDIIMHLYEENSNESENFEIFIQGYMNILVGTLYRHGILENIEKNYNKEAVKKVWQAIEYVDKNYQRDITLEDLATTQNMNKEYFCRIFKKATNTTPTEYVNYVRIWKAENLLTTTRDNILEVSMAVGFSSVSYFNRVFKKLKGTSPSAYRNILYAKNKLM